MQRWQIESLDLRSLKQVEAPKPTPALGQILVRTQAVSLNYRDLMITGGTYAWAPPLPFTPCSDLAGVVEVVGPGVTRWKGGEQIISTFVAGWLDGKTPTGTFSLGGPGPGALASHVLIDEQWAVEAPRTLNADQASTLPCAALTAWFSYFEEGSLKAGDTVLIHGTGGVALFGLQFARMHGATVIVVSGGAGKRDKALALGASHVIARDADWPAEVRRLTEGRGADHVLETVGGTNLARSLSAVAQGGRISLIGVIEGGSVETQAIDFIRSRAVLQGISVGHRRALQDMVRAIDATRLKPVIDKVYGFADVPAAFEQLQRGAFGKVVVSLGGG
ncbi:MULTISPECIES: NAD(P)-dependent alcohol dehydrogenase [unclassified Variovorax]|uniref:zinc-dependent alcohol dehydrogenase family protein n=1 Tax=unclassified Variovorax TaxID=663243 RepID=UPI0008D767CF|nr:MULTISPECIES: NAD(P)-dependent alcohol dehydrogenase [unclassified Variovorax]SEK16579.1 NADPH:quinone reductase [Variovorax sp. OK202]SFE53145.1 NADPH:quinone reductase [Variovorax sp. OK212]